MGEDEVATEFEIFKDAMREENLELQLEITKKLGILAKHLGTETTRNELLPFIKENIDFHDEILLNLSEQLKHFIPLVGGYQHSQPIMEVLIKLCNTDENVVRDKAVEILKDIAENLTREQIQEMFLPVIETLANVDWFTSKCSAASLYSTVYMRVSDEYKAQLRNNFRAFFQDDSPIVRRVACINLLELIPAMEQDTVYKEIFPIFEHVASDPMDTVRVYAVDLSIAIAEKLTEEQLEQNLFKRIESWADAESWRIRQRLAYYIGDLHKSIPYPKLRGKILALFQKLVKDLEPEVRIVIAKNLFYYCQSLQDTYKTQPKFEDNFEPVFQQSIMPQIDLLMTDPCLEVKLELSSNVLALSTVLREECYCNNILPLLIDVLENETSMSIQANMLQNLNFLPASIDLTKSMHSVTNVIRSLIFNSKTHWRTRRSIFIAFMHITKFSSKEYFNENFKNYYAMLVSDPIFAIRRTAPMILPLLAKQYGMSWISENIIPYFNTFVSDCRYLYRFIPIFGIIELVSPTLDCSATKDEEYLKDLKVLTGSSNSEVKNAAVRALARISNLLNKLTKKLQQEQFENILSLSKFIYGFKDDTNLYAAETIDALKIDNNCNIYSVKEEVILKNQPTYLEDVLSLILRNFLFIIETLSDDAIENVQVRSIYALNKIQQFNSKLDVELNKPWVQEILKTLTDEETLNVENQIEEELSKKVVQIKIDPELMETILISNENNLPDLGTIHESETDDNSDEEEENTVLKPEGDVVTPEISEAKLEQEDGGPIYLNLETNSNTDVAASVSPNTGNATANPQPDAKNPISESGKSSESTT